MSVFKTSHQGLCAMLRYAQGDAAHIATRKLKNGHLTFVFDDPNNDCHAIAKMFFEPDGAAVSDARLLLDQLRAVRLTATHAINNGIWENGQ